MTLRGARVLPGRDAGQPERRGDVARSEYARATEAERPAGARTFGAYLHEQRVRRGFARSPFAALLGVAPARLADLERNASPPTYAELCRLAFVLDVPQTELLARAGYITRRWLARRRLRLVTG
jgi:hypothetical protein